MALTILMMQRCSALCSALLCNACDAMRCDVMGESYDMMALAIGDE